MNIRQIITHNLENIPGWRSRRHIVVFESDDWGSLRMPSQDVYHKLLDYGIRVDKCHYCMNDSLATEEDLARLFEVLCSVKDQKGKPAIMTANVVVANPDFERIRACNFEQYFYRTISEDIPNHFGCEHSLDLWREGNQKGFFVLQSHGREHLNVNRWMQYLRGNYPETRFAFSLGVYGISKTISSEKRKTFLAAFDFENQEEEAIVNGIASEGLDIFERLFGFRSKSFIAPNYTWGRSLEAALKQGSVSYIQGRMISKYVRSGNKQEKNRLRYIGRENYLGQIDLCRNSIFEPSSDRSKDWVDSCLSDMEIAFRWRHPAIISAHRVNFISSLNISNRDDNLKQFGRLLREIVKKWPDVEFMSSDQLGDLIIKGSNND